jgi:hypothetical protein
LFAKRKKTQKNKTYHFLFDAYNIHGVKSLPIHGRVLKLFVEHNEVPKLAILPNKLR